MAREYTEQPNRIGGVQRLYKLPNGYTISAINAAEAHIYPFAWECAVLDPQGQLDYSTPLTSDVEVFLTEAETRDFIETAYSWSREAKSKAPDQPKSEDEL